MALLLIDDLLKHIDANEHFKQMLVFVSGPTGSGKTTLGESLRKKHNFIHWDADLWANGYHPVNDCAKSVDFQSDEYKNRSPELIKAWDIVQKDGYQKLFANEKPEPSAFETFYGLMAKQINIDRKIYKDKHIAVVQALLTKSHRDYMRKALGEDLTFIILNTSKDLLLDRFMSRTQKECDKLGITMEQRLKSWKSDATVESVKELVASSSNGFEAMEKNEPNTYQIEINKTTNVDDVLIQAQKMLNLGSNGAF